MPLCSCEMEIAVFIGHCALLLHMDRVSEDLGSGDGGTTAVQHQQNASRDTHTRTLPLTEDTLSIALEHGDAAWTAAR